MQVNFWQIKCNHRAESLDRIVSPFRKRGLLLNSLEYKASGDMAVCNIEFELDDAGCQKLHSNLMRIFDVAEIEQLQPEKS